VTGRLGPLVAVDLDGVDVLDDSGLGALLVAA
jgi:anti-anti-sigma regulatory factor